VPQPEAKQVIRFGTFEVDPRTGELRKNGLQVRLQDQPFQVLLALLLRPGEVVTREELRAKLWPADTFVDFEHGLNAAVKRLRDALGDTAENPRFIETLPRHGYRFIGTIASLPRVPGVFRESGESAAEPPAPVKAQDRTTGRLKWLKVGVAILAAAACVLAVLLVYLRIRTHPDSAVLAAVPFTAYPGVQTCPAFSPDGSQIVFAWNGDPASGSKGFDLYVKVIGSENLLRLTHHPSDFICPAWSPDGTQIAFHRISGADTGVYVIPALGGPERKLRPAQIGDWDAAAISWSPDGKWIAYVEALPPNADLRLFLLSVETLQSSQIPHAAECLAEKMPVFSHSGGQLAYFCVDNLQNETRGLCTIATSGGTPKLVATLGSVLTLGAAAWTADDKKLVFSKLPFQRRSELYEVTLADGSLRKLPTAQGTSWPAISPKGDKLAYVTTISGGLAEIWRRDLLNPRAPGVKLIPSTYSQFDVQYSPDGRHIAFDSHRGGVQEVWISDANGTHLVQISNFKYWRTGTPNWSPDSQKIVFDTRRSDIGELYIADITERMPRKLATNITDIVVPSWSHDGKWIYFLSAGASRHGIYRCPANGGDAVLLAALPPGDLGTNPQESFDGETVYFATTWVNFNLEMVSIKRPGIISVVDPRIKVCCYGDWTVARGGIYFVPLEAPKSVHYFDFKTKEIRAIFDIDKSFALGMSVSWDGRWLLYSQLEEENDNIMLVDPFR
jgi:Tol biopolymer transport system component/DNA-binding winged helix-turn-helix (wHTH) protein